MIFYKTECGKLIRYNPETKIYLQVNIVEKIDRRISSEDFLKLKYVKLKKTKFYEYLNIYFKDVQHEWEHDGKIYRKLPNFSENFKIGDVPVHSDFKYNNRLIFVYHHGKVYYHTISYNGYEQGQLVDIKTGKYLSWAQLKHCAPILCVTTNKII